MGSRRKSGSFRPLLFLKALRKNPLAKVDIFEVLDALLDEMVVPLTIHLDRRAMSNYGFLVLASFRLLREWPDKKSRKIFLERVREDLRCLGSRAATSILMPEDDRRMDSFITDTKKLIQLLESGSPPSPGSLLDFGLRRK